MPDPKSMAPKEKAQSKQQLQGWGLLCPTPQAFTKGKEKIVSVLGEPEIASADRMNWRSKQ